MKNYVKFLKNNSFKVVVVTVLSVTFFVAGVALYAQVWTPPTQDPPGGNPTGFILADPSQTQDADLDISGDALVGGLRVFNDRNGVGYSFFNDDIIILGDGRLCFDNQSADSCIANKDDVGQTLFTESGSQILTDIQQLGVAGLVKYISLTSGISPNNSAVKIQVMDNTPDSLPAGDEAGGDWVQLTTDRVNDESALTWGDNASDVLHISHYYFPTTQTIPVATFRSPQVGGQVGIGDTNPDTKLTIYSTGYGDVLKVYNSSNLPIVAGFDSSNGNGYIASKNGAPLRLESNSSSFEVSPNKDAYGHIYADYTSSDNTAGGIRLWSQNGSHLGTIFGIDQNTPPSSNLDVFGLMNSIGKWIMVNASNGTTGTNSAYTYFYLGTPEGNTRELELTRDGLSLTNVVTPGAVKIHRDKTLQSTSGDLIFKASDESQAALQQHSDVIVQLTNATDGVTPGAPQERFVVRTPQVLGDGSYDFFKITNYAAVGGQGIGPRVEIGGAFRDPCAGGVCNNPISGTLDPLVSLRNNDASTSQYDNALYVDNQGAGWSIWVNNNTPENPPYRYGMRIDADPSINTAGSFDKSVALFVNGVFRLQDGTQAPGKILTAVTNGGHAKWEYPADIGLGADLWTETGRGVSYPGDYSIGQIRVGIGGSKTTTGGTWTPIGATIGATLDVIGPQWGTYEPVARFRNNDAFFWANGGDELLVHEKWGGGGASERAILNAKNYNNTSIFRVQPNGLVCINDDCRSTWNGDGTGLVTKIIAGTGISVNPASGVGDVTVSALSQSPWLTGTGGAIYYNSGNVGIGLTNPASKLEVLGTLNNGVMGRTTGAGAGVVGVSDGTLSIGVHGVQKNGLAAGLFEGAVYADQFCLKSGPGSSISGDCRNSWNAVSPWSLSTSGTYITNLVGSNTGTHKNVGIGVDSPAAPLEVSNLGNINALTLRNPTNVSASGSQVGLTFKFSNDSGNEANKWAAIRGVSEAAYANKVGLAFYTSPSYTAPPTEVMRLTSGGDLNLTGALDVNDGATISNGAFITGGATIGGDVSIGNSLEVIAGDLWVYNKIRFADGKVRPEIIYGYVMDCGGNAHPSQCGTKSGDSRITHYYQETPNAHDYLFMVCPEGFSAIGGGGSCDYYDDMKANQPWNDREWFFSCGDEIADTFRMFIKCARFNW